MRELTLDNLTTSEKEQICILINEDASSEIFATIESMPYFASDYVYSLVKEEAKECPSMKEIQYKLYNS